MATSPNYNWPEPDNTDLVKNGALAIRTLGNAIDTTMATMTPKSLVDAKGDLVTATANDTPARLAVGNNGETLVADSSTATGLRYQVPVNVNPVLNSAMQVWQRGTSIACTTTSYTADRWQGYRAVAGSTVSRQTTGDTTNLPFIQYCARVQRDSGNTSTSTIYFSQSFESINSIPYVGKTVTLSFYARSGANFTNPLVTRLYTGTGTDQNILVSYTGAANPIAENTTLTTTWQRFTYTATIATTATELALRFDYTPSGTAGAADYFEVTGVQLEVGSVATPFKTYAGTIQGELAACQRYYWRFTGGNGNFAAYGTGVTGSTTQSDVFVQFPTSMRTRPTTVEFSTLALGDGSAVAAVSTLTVLRSNEMGATLAAGATGLTQFRPYQLLNNSNSTTAYLGVSAEL